MSTATASQPGRNFLVTFIGLFTFMWGLLHIVFGLYIMLAGADVALQLLQAGEEAKKQAGAVRGEVQPAGEAADVGAKGMAGFLGAAAGAFGICTMLLGLPEILAGFGVVRRKPWGRILTLILAVLALLGGLGSLANFSQGGSWIALGMVQIVYAIAAFYALIKYGYEFTRQPA